MQNYNETLEITKENYTLKQPQQTQNNNETTTKA